MIPFYYGSGSDSGSGTVINYSSGYDFLAFYGSGSTGQKVTAPTVPVPVPQRCFLYNCSFPARNLVDQDQRSKTKNAESTGDGGDDSLVHEANPDQPHVGGVSPRLFYGWRTHTRRTFRSFPSGYGSLSGFCFFVSDLQYDNKKSSFFSTVFLPFCLLLFKGTFISFFKVIKKSQNQCCFIKQK